MRINDMLYRRIAFILLATFMLSGVVMASNSTINTTLTVVGLPAGAQIPVRFAPNFTTVTYTATGYTTAIPVWISPSTDTTYSGLVPYQWQGAGTTVTYAGVTYTMVGSTYTQQLQVGKNNVLGFYVYLNSSLWNSNEKAELQSSNSSLNTAKIMITAINNVSNSIPYGSAGLQETGTSSKYAIYSNGTVSFVNTTVVPHLPDYACINLTSSLFSSSVCNPGVYKLPVTVIGGRFGINGPISLSITASLSSSLLSNNKVPFGATIKVGSNVLYSISNDNLSSLSQSATFTYYAGEALNITIDALGGKNYSPEDPTVTPPAGIVAYVPITFVNTQNTALNANAPLEVGVASGNVIIGYNAIAYQQYEIPNLTNHEYFLANGEVLNSWLEGNYFNDMVANTLATSLTATNALSNSANIIEWVLPPSGFLTSNSGSSPTNTVYLGWSGNTVNVGNVLFNSKTTGEAPQLSCPNTYSTGACNYGIFDTGNFVFGVNGFYDNFACTGGSYPCALDASWTLSANAVGMDYYQANSLILSYTAVGSTYIGIHSSFPIANTMTSQFLMFGHSISGGNGPAIQFGTSNTATFNTGTGTYTGEVSDQVQNIAGQNSQYLIETVTNSKLTLVSPYGPIQALPDLVSLYWASNPVNMILTDYPSLLVKGAVSANIPMASTQYLDIGESGGGTSANANVMWVRAIAALPSNTMPYSVFGSVTTVSYTAPTVTQSVSNTLIDTTQWETLTATISNGASPFTINFLVYNSVTKAQIANELLTGDIATTNTFTFQVPSYWTTNTLFYSNVFVTDSHPTTVNSVLTAKIPVNAFPVAATINSIPTLAGTIDVGEVWTMNDFVSGGTLPFTYNFLVYNSITKIQVANNLVTYNGFAYTIPSGENGNTLVANVFITDSATTNVIVNSILTGVLTVDPALTAGQPTPVNPTIDNGQTITLSATPGGGTPGYTYQWYTDSGNNCVSLTIIGGATSSTYAASPASSTYYCYIVTDSATLPGVATSSSPTHVVVNSALGIPTIKPSSAASYDIGQTFPVNAYVSGGTTTYTYNFLIYNSITNVQIANELLTSNNFLYNPLSSMAGNTITVNVFVTDSAYSPATTNSILSGVQTINAALSPTLTASNTPTVNPLNYETLTAMTGGGTSTFTYNFLVYNSVTGVLMTNDLLKNVAGTTQTFTFQVPSAWLGNTITANVIVTDSATTPTSVRSASISTITVTSSTAPSLVLPSNNMIYNSLFTVQGSSAPSTHTTSIYLTLLGQTQGSPIIINGTGVLTYTFCSGSNVCPGIGQYTVNVVDTITSSSTTGMLTVYVPIMIKNTTGTSNILVGIIPGYQNAVNNNAGGNYIGSITYSSSQTLSKNLVILGNLTINSGAVLTTNGFSIIQSGYGDNLGTILTGNAVGGGTYGLYWQAANIIPGMISANGIMGVTPAVNIDGENGGYGAGVVILATSITTPSTSHVYVAGGANSILSSSVTTCGSTYAGGTGGSTLSAGGGGGNGGSGNAGAGNVGPTLTVTNANVLFMFSNTIWQYLIGATGATGGTCGGAGSPGISNVLSFGGSGSGGGGSALSGNGGKSAPGGNGQVITYQYTTPPIRIGIYNDNYPIEIYTYIPSALFNYTVAQTYNSVTTNVLVGVYNLTYQPYAGQPAGVYQYNITEWQNTGGKVNILVNVSINMTDITAPLSFNNPIIQYFPNFLNTPTFSIIPNYYFMASDLLANQHSNTITGDQWSYGTSANFPTNLILAYNGFTQFSVYIPNNPNVQATINQYPYNFIVSNAIPSSLYSGTYVRKLLNGTVGDQRTFLKLTSNATLVFRLIFNNYTIINSSNYAYNSIAANSFAVYVGESNYQNPSINVTSSTLSAVAVSHYLGVNNYCPTILSNSQFIQAHPYLVDLNGSLYAFQINQGYQNGGVGDFIQVYDGVSSYSSKLVQQYKINGNFSLPLENGGSYAFTLVNGNCNFVYTTNYSVGWMAPIKINLPLNISIPTVTLPKPVATCTKVIVSQNVMNVNCMGSDVTNTITSWNIQLFNTTYNGYNLIASNTFASNSFAISYNGLSNSSIYRVLATASAPGFSQAIPIDFNTNIPTKGFSVPLRALLTILFMLVGLGLSAIGEAQGTISAQHAVSSTLVLTDFMFLLSWLVGLSTFIPSPIAVVIMVFLLIIAVMSHRYESGYQM